MRNILTKQVLLFFRDAVYALINPLIISITYRDLREKINSLEDDTQLFFLNRDDFGSYPILLTYCNLWQSLRGPTALVVFAAKTESLIHLASVITPNTRVIVTNTWIARLAKKFGKYCFYHKSMNKVYGWLIADRPDALYFFHSPVQPHPKKLFSDFHPALDPILNETQHHSEVFISQYKVARRQHFDCRKDVFDDFLKLYQQQTPLSVKTELIIPVLAKLKAVLKIPEKYVLLNLNLKKYDKLASRRSIFNPQSYVPLIELLNKLGYKVVVHGRDEQPYFPEQLGVIDYAHSSLASVEGDLALFYGAQFAICSSSGPENLTLPFRTPLLNLNTVELTTLCCNVKSRYFPKHVYRLGTEEKITPLEYLEHPAFFDIGSWAHGSVEYRDLDANEMLEALKEFIQLINQPSTTWLDYSKEQATYKSRLSPLHLDAYTHLAVPSNEYLKGL